MDEETSRRIRELAHSLKKAHLATTMEEAFARAESIVKGTKSDDNRPLNEVMSVKSAVKSVDVEVQRVVHEEVALDKIRQELKELKKQASGAERLTATVQESVQLVRDDKQLHEEEVETVEELKRRVAAGERAVGDAAEVIRLAEKVQRSKK